MLVGQGGEQAQWGLGFSHDVWGHCRLKVSGRLDSWRLESPKGSFTCMAGTGAEDWKIRCAYQNAYAWLLHMAWLPPSIPVSGLKEFLHGFLGHESSSDGMEPDLQLST